MALKVKAWEKLLKFSKNSEGEYRYVMQPELYSALDKDKVIREAALRSGVSEGVMKACWDAAGEVIKAWLPEGHSIPLPGLGSCRFGLSAETVTDVNKVKTSLIKTRRIVFVPSVDLKEELKNTSIVITCFDRNGDIVKRVTSADDGTVEEPDTTDTTGENTTDNTQGGSSTGGGSNTNDTNGTNGGGTSSNTDNTNPTDEPGGSGGNTGGGTTGGGIEEG